MKCVILAGGLGTRISEESHLRPKPMIEIGGRPILWHIMKIYSRYGINEFVVCLGYRGYIIKEYFTNYFLHQSDVTIETAKNKMTFHQSQADDWKVTLVDTGENSMTGGRLKRVGQHLTTNEPFCMTYGDGVSDIDIGKLVAFHKAHGKQATLTAVVPPGRYGAIEIDGDLVKKFQEKPPGDMAFINGGFFVLDPAVLARIEGDETPWERGPLEGLAKDRQLAAFRHLGFWHPMDTLRDKNMLEEMWAAKRAPWKVWT